MTSAFHLAAIYNLAVPLELAQRVNVDGTGNVLELCAAAEQARAAELREHRVRRRRPHGRRLRARARARPGVQEPLRVDQVPGRGLGARGDGRRPDDDLPARRSWSATRGTGETQKFDGPYYMLRVISFCESRGMPIPQFGRSAAPFNVVPVDFVVDALVAGSLSADAVGETLHLVDPEPVTASELLTTLAQGVRGPRAVLPRCRPSLVEASLRFEFVRNLFAGAPRESIRYLNHPVRFDTRRAERPARRPGPALSRASTSTWARWCASSASTRTTRRSCPRQPDRQSAASTSSVGWPSSTARHHTSPDHSRSACAALLAGQTAARPPLAIDVEQLAQRAVEQELGPRSTARCSAARRSRSRASGGARPRAEARGRQGRAAGPCGPAPSAPRAAGRGRARRGAGRETGRASRSRPASCSCPGG